VIAVARHYQDILMDRTGSGRHQLEKMIHSMDMAAMVTDTLPDLEQRSRLAREVINLGYPFL
jgi:hypothetical protein